MELTIYLSPEEENQLEAQARQNGLELAQYARKRLGLAEPADVQPDAENMALINLLRSWREEDATEDKAELERRDAELEAFKSSINATCAANGEEAVLLMLQAVFLDSVLSRFV